MEAQAGILTRTFSFLHKILRAAYITTSRPLKIIIIAIFVLLAWFPYRGLVGYAFYRYKFFLATLGYASPRSNWCRDEINFNLEHPGYLWMNAYNHDWFPVNGCMGNKEGILVEGELTQWLEEKAKRFVGRYLVLGLLALTVFCVLRWLDGLCSKIEAKGTAVLSRLHRVFEPILLDVSEQVIRPIQQMVPFLAATAPLPIFSIILLQFIVATSIHASIDMISFLNNSIDKLVSRILDPNVKQILDEHEMKEDKKRHLKVMAQRHHDEVLRQCRIVFNSTNHS